MLGDFDNRRHSHLGQGKEPAAKSGDSVGPQTRSIRLTASAVFIFRDFLPTESGIHQVQAAPSFVWKPVTRKVDAGVINDVAPPRVGEGPRVI